MDLSFREVLKLDSEIRKNKTFVFKPTSEERRNGLMHICYSCASNVYVRKSLGVDVDRAESWLDWTYSCTNIFRKVEYDHKMVYLARDEVRSPPGGELSWRFDLTGTDCKMDKLEFRAPCAIYEDGCIIWTICTDKQNFVQTDESMDDKVTFELEGATQLTITAFLTGGLGCCLYQHAQLFRQPFGDDDDFPFEILLYLQSSETTGSNQSAESCEEIKKGYIFTPNQQECRDQRIRVELDVSRDTYSRHSLSNEAELSSWLDYTYSSTNMIRKHNAEEDRECLTMGEATDFGKVSWKFDTADSGLSLKLLHMKAPSNVSRFRNISVKWLICTGKQCYMETGDELDKRMTFELEGATELSITAFLKGGSGNVLLLNDNLTIELELEENPLLSKGTTKTSVEEVDDNLIEIAEARSGFIFKPREEEIEKKMMHICYSCANDTYHRKSSENEVLQSWQSCTNENSNLFRKEDTYKWMTYLVREDGDRTAHVSWKFDVKETDLRMTKVEIRASSSVFRNGSVSWIISSEKDIYTSQSLQFPSIFNLSDASVLTISANQGGGHGFNAWEHSQLFPQPSDDVESYPFEVKVFMDMPGSSPATGRSIDASGWRMPKWSLGLPAEICKSVNKSFVFKPTDQECKSQLMHIRYCCASDTYSRGLSPDDQTMSWSNCTFSSTNIYRKEEYDHNMVYLARIEGTQYAEITWKFDVTGSGFRMSDLELIACTKLYQDALVLWTIRGGVDQAYIRTAHYFRSDDHSEVFDLNDALTVTITAFLTGGKGLVAWQHSQIFRQGLFTEDAFPFDVKIYLKASEERPQIGIFGIPAKVSCQTDNNFAFKPNTIEFNKKLMHITYETTEDMYDRHINDGTEAFWQSRTYSSKNLILVEDDSSMGSYIGRVEGSQFAEVTWKFDMTDESVGMDVLELKAQSECDEDGCIVWVIQADDQRFIQTGESLKNTMTFQLAGSRTLSLTAYLTGGKGKAPWRQTRLFPKKCKDNPKDCPFEMTVILRQRRRWEQPHSEAVQECVVS